MNLLELSRQYRLSGELCRERVALLKPRIADENISEQERLLLRRRVTILTAMARETIAISRLLEKYYEGKGTGND